MSAALPMHNTVSSASSSPSKHLGFWTGETDLWSGGAITGKNSPYTPQQFFNVYFNQAPYPSGMLFVTALSPTGPYAGNIYNGIGGWKGEAEWLNAFLAICDAHANIQIIILAFVNLSGGTINGHPDQTASFTTYMNMIKGHHSVYGVEYENEYYGDTSTIEYKFASIVTNAGYVDVLNPRDTGYFSTQHPVLGYSTYPYFDGTIPTSLKSGFIGYGYGETGTPPAGEPNPIWTQQTVQAIVDKSPSAPFTLIYAQKGGNGQPLNSLWNWPTFRAWVWNAPDYQGNFVLSDSPSSTSTTSVTTTSSTSTTSSTATTSTQSTTSTSSASSSDPPSTISNNNPSVGSWVKVTGSGFPPSSTLEAIVFNNSTGSYAAYLYPGSTSSTGTLSFSMKITSAMAGADTLYIYSPASATSANYQSSVQFTTS